MSKKEDSVTIGLLKDALQELLLCVEEPPDANCSCHINPPCGDCEQYSHTRMTLAGARDLLKRLDEEEAKQYEAAMEQDGDRERHGISVGELDPQGRVRKEELR